MRKIQLTRGLHTIVDDEIFEKIGHLSWFALSAGKGRGFYAARNVPAPEKKQGRKTFLLHHLILAPQPGFEVDHRDGDKLNNLRTNLRHATFAQQRQNVKGWKTKKSGQFKGVYKKKGCARWEAALHTKKKTFYLGLFTTEIAAAQAYNEAAKLHFGEFACINRL